MMGLDDSRLQADPLPTSAADISGCFKGSVVEAEVIKFENRLKLRSNKVRESSK